MAELHVSNPTRARAPLFPGRDAKHQLELIVSYTGKPSSSFIALCNKPWARLMLQSLPPSPCIINKSHLPPPYCYLYRGLFPTATAGALSMMNRCLSFHTYLTSIVC